MPENGVRVQLYFCNGFKSNLTRVVTTKQAIRKIYAGEEGFTLIEIAIVMVIVGLLLGGVLKGQEMIENGRVRNAISSLDGVSAAYNSYFDRYRRIPGDDGPNVAALTARGGNWANITQAGNNNGVLLTAAGNTFNGGDENDNFWQHMRAAGFITGNPAAAGVTALPINAFSGLTGITNAATIMADGSGAALNGNKVCLGRVPGKAAAAIDTQLDDGVSNTGSVRATLGTAGTNTTPGVTAVTPPYNEDNEYTVCRTF
jgi:prepilin-type N-terminal cleavage/methylation domain-containing protein